MISRPLNSRHLEAAFIAVTVLYAVAVAAILSPALAGLAAP